jgi:hypothetical protein
MTVIASLYANEARSSIMLILTRRVGETVMIGNEVTVTVFKREEDHDSRPGASVANIADDA